MGDVPFAEAHGGCVVIGDVWLEAAVNPCSLVQDAADKINSAVAALVAAARKEERERIAKVVEERAHRHDEASAQWCGYESVELIELAAAIRALGE